MHIPSASPALPYNPSNDPQRPRAKVAPSSALRAERASFTAGGDLALIDARCRPSGIVIEPVAEGRWAEISTTGYITLSGAVANNETIGFDGITYTLS